MNPSLLIVGAGRLGRRVGRLWNGHATAETATSRAHAELEQEGLFPRLRSSEGKFESVLFAIPPSTSEGTYFGETERALGLWDKTGSFVFVSSTGVYAEENGGNVDEHSAEAKSERAELLLKTERLVRSRSGTILRLAGLYDEASGPHRVYLRKDTSDLPGHGWLNLIHYDDAAALCLKLLETRFLSETFLGCDNTPITREEVSRLAAEAEGKMAACQFAKSGTDLGRKCNNDETREALHWTPRWKSFADFIRGA